MKHDGIMQLSEYLTALTATCKSDLHRNHLLGKYNTKKEILLNDNIMLLKKARLSRIFMLVIGNSNWRRRWLDFRNGHSIYLVFLMTFATFVTIQYKLLIEKAPFLSSTFSSIWIFAIAFIAIYLPLGMAIGYWHRKSQFSVEAEALFSQNQVGAMLDLFLIDLIDGKVTEEEKQRIRSYLLKVMKRNSPPSINGNGNGNGKEDTNKSSPRDTKINTERTE